MTKALNFKIPEIHIFTTVSLLSLDILHFRKCSFFLDMNCGFSNSVAMTKIKKNKTPTFALVVLWDGSCCIHTNT